MRRYERLTDEESEEFVIHCNKMLGDAVNNLIEISNEERNLIHINNATLNIAFMENLCLYLFKNYIEQFDKETHINQWLEHFNEQKNIIVKEVIQKLRKMN